MPTNLVEADVFTANIPVADDGEDADGDSLVQTAQGLANRTRYLTNRHPTLGNVTYTVNVPLVGLVDESGVDQFAWRRDAVANETYWEQQSLGESSVGANLIIPLSIPIGAKLVSLTLFSRGAGHSFMPATMPSMRLQRQTEYGGRILLGTQSVSAVDLAAYEAGVDTTLAFSPELVQTTGRNLHLDLTGETGSGAINTGWRVYNLEMTLRGSGA